MQPALSRPSERVATRLEFPCGRVASSDKQKGLADRGYRRAFAFAHKQKGKEARCPQTGWRLARCQDYACATYLCRRQRALHGVRDERCTLFELAGH